jgi:secondary thiamine-phosphate synthase enzyme
MLKKIIIKTPPDENMVDITMNVREVIKQSGVKEGLCLAFVPHTTAALTINSIMDPATLADLKQEIMRIVPTRVDFEHIYDTPSDAAGHIKSSLIGPSLSMNITKGELFLGRSQGILFWEFDGPRQREIHIRIIEDSEVKNVA